MRLGRSLTGNPVVGAQDGRNVGTVRDLVLDAGLTKVVALHLESDSVLRRASCHIARDDVALFGMDVILARSAEAVRDGAATATDESWLRLDGLQGRQVDTPGGTRIGQIDDVILDEDAYVVGFSLRRLAVEGPVAESRAISCEAVVDSGAVDGIMTVDLAKAEQQDLRVDPGSLFSAARVAEGEVG